MIVYIKTQGARIVKEGRHLLVKRGDDIHHTLFTYKLNQVVLFGNVEITHSALVQLLRNEVDVVFLSQNGRYLGRLATPEARNVFLHKRQYRLLDDEAFGLRAAKAMVGGKMINMATLLLRIKRTRHESLAGRKAEAIQDLNRQLATAESIDSIRGYEGRGAAHYFEAFPRGFLEDWGFSRRVRRPPTDPVNSVLSLLYTFLMNRVYAAVRIASLDPYPGFLHTIDYGRYSLVLDLMEEFRPIIADTLTLSLFNLRILKKEDFYMERSEAPDTDAVPPEHAPDVTKDPLGLMTVVGVNEISSKDLPEQRMDIGQSGDGTPTGRYPVKLTNDAFRRVIEAFEKKLTTEFFHPPADRQLTYAEALIYQAHHFRKVIEGEMEVYQPLLLK